MNFMLNFFTILWQIFLRPVIDLFFYAYSVLRSEFMLNIYDTPGNRFVRYNKKNYPILYYNIIRFKYYNNNYTFSRH